MRSTNKTTSVLSIAALFVLMVATGCASDTDSSNPSLRNAPTGDNVMPITVNGSLCGTSGGAYSNQPCVSVTICSHGTDNCQTINNILLDTGSYGLRLFGSTITVPLTPVTDGTKNLAECVQFGDGSSEWGPLEYADVKLGNEPAVQTPIEVINSTYATPPALCSASQSTPDTSPEQAGFNGILGVGLFAQDCGTKCETQANNNRYYGCTGNTCKSTTAKVAMQIQNPVTLLPGDNNGVLLELPSVGDQGAQSASGYLVLGIGTRTNNTPSGVSAYQASSDGNFSTEFTAAGNSQLTSFIDSGSSLLFFPSPTNGVLPDCNSVQGGSHGADYAGFFCPSSDENLTAQNVGAGSGSAQNVSFEISNAFNLLGNGNMVFANIGAAAPSTLGAVFDWGLPFFYGKQVFVGIDQTTSSLGTGPYWAY